MPSPTHTIGQLARQAGVPVSTVRYYERRGLLRPDGRTAGNYRHYRQAALDRLRFIRSAQATGFSLRDIEELLGLSASDELPCDDVTAVTKKRLAEVRQRLRELRHVESVLARSLRSCCKGEEIDLCRDIGRLQGRDAALCTPDAGACKTSRKQKSAARA
jgi:DNA-binding transcriptional MerR regulator